MIAIKRLQNILWILIVAFGALTAYLISLRVATERNAVQDMERHIYAERAAVRYLETEFEARSNMRQLEKWNAQDYRYVAPQAAQYLPDERSLASLDRVPSNGDTYVAPPVMMAMVASNADLPDAAATHTASPAAPQAHEEDMPSASAAPAAPAPTHSAPVVDKPSVKPVRPVVRTAAAALPAPAPIRVAQILKAHAPDVSARKAARMAMLDDKLLDDHTLRDLGVAAAAEGRARGNR